MAGPVGNEGDELAARVAIGRAPGVDQVITIAGISALDNSSSLANAGVAYLILQEWSARGKGEDLRSLFAGLNVLPKKSFAADYSYRSARPQQEKLLREWVKALSAEQASSFSLDFHAIPYRGEDAVLDNHWLPRRGKAGRRTTAWGCGMRR